jgi:hypothetical protein
VPGFEAPCDVPGAIGCDAVGCGLRGSRRSRIHAHTNASSPRAKSEQTIVDSSKAQYKQEQLSCDAVTRSNVRVAARQALSAGLFRMLS